MNDDDELCLCFHVSRRKVVQFIRTQKPRVASQLSECYGAGTGCGWCRPFLQRLLSEADPDAASLPAPESYAAQRREYRVSLQADSRGIGTDAAPEAEVPGPCNGLDDQRDAEPDSG